MTQKSMIHQEANSTIPAEIKAVEAVIDESLQSHSNAESAKSVNKTTLAEQENSENREQQRKENKLRQLLDRERLATKKERDLSEREKQVERYQQMEKLAKENPHELLNHLGISFDELAKSYSQKDAPDGVKPKIEQLHQSLQKLQQENQNFREEIDREKTQRMEDYYQFNIHKLIQNKADDHEILSLCGEQGVKHVYGIIYDDLREQYAQGHEQPKPISIEEACGQAEANLVESLLPDLKKLSQAKKFTDVFKPSQSHSENSKLNKEPQAVSQLRTFTTKTPSHAIERASKPLSPEEHDRLAIDLWNQLQRKKGFIK